MDESRMHKDDPLLAFLERGEKLPPRVTNAMLLLALRAERQARQADVDSLRARLDALVLLLRGRPGGAASPTRPGGLLDRVEALERTARWAGAVLWPAALAFLGAAGAWLFGLLVR